MRRLINKVMLSVLVAAPLLLLVVVQIDKADAFVPFHRPCGVARSSHRLAVGDNDGATPHASERGFLSLPNDFRMFLNQCSVQSFLFLLRQVRDVHTLKYVEDFTRPNLAIRERDLTAVFGASANKQDKGSGSDADADADDTDVDSGAIGSSHNLEDDLAAAGENRQGDNQDGDNDKDGADGNDNDDNDEDSGDQTSSRSAIKLLQYHGLAAMNTTAFPTWDAYFDELLDRPEEILVIESSQAHIPEYEIDIKPASLCARLLSVREQIANEFLRDLDVVATMGGNTLDEYLESVRNQRDDDDRTDDKVSGVRIERQNLLFLEWDPNDIADYAPSPLRKGNFDLLTLLTTQEAIHRLLNDESRQEGADAAANEYLYNFYMERAESFFVGIQRWGRTDDFIEDLLNASPVLKAVKGSSTSALIDPTRIAEDIVERREDVALDWREIAREVPHEHFDVRKKMLSKLMGVTQESP